MQILKARYLCNLETATLVYYLGPLGEDSQKKDDADFSLRCRCGYSRLRWTDMADHWYRSGVYSSREVMNRVRLLVADRLPYEKVRRKPPDY